MLLFSGTFQIFLKFETLKSMDLWNGHLNLWIYGWNIYIYGSMDGKSGHTNLWHHNWNIQNAHQIWNIQINGLMDGTL